MFTIALATTLVNAIRERAPQLVLHSRPCVGDLQNSIVTLGIYNERNLAILLNAVYNAGKEKADTNTELLDSVAA